MRTSSASVIATTNTAGLRMVTTPYTPSPPSGRTTASSRTLIHGLVYFGVLERVVQQPECVMTRP